MRSITTAALLSLAAGAASAAGTVNVAFVDPEKYYDAGTTKLDVPANLKVIEEHLKYLGQRFLPEGQVLNISVLDVDLAGTVHPGRRSGNEVRIAKGGADWPRITVRYALESNGSPIKNGEEVVSDLSYGRHGPSTYSTLDPLHHEKWMLEGWFQARFKPED